LFGILFAYAIQTFYPSPQYENFCHATKNQSANINNIVSCESNGGQWMDFSKEYTSQPNQGWCNLNVECQKEFASINKVYERNVFFANLGVGILVFIIAFFLGLESISSGLMGGSVMLIVYGSIRYWGELNNAWRTLMLGIALAILIWLGYKKIK